MNLKRYLKLLDKKLLKALIAAGRTAKVQDLRAYLVGGFVRDMLLKIKNFDVDIVVSAQGIKFAQTLSRKFNSKITAHKRFGTAVICGKDFKIDISTFRKERYPYPGSLPVVSAGSLVDDLGRRDFSINALAVSINKNDFGHVVDYFGGIEDLEKKQLRVLHKDSFLDDPTRILRLVRFKSRFGFLIEPATKKLIQEARSAKVLEKMQKHRVRDELILIFKEPKPEDALRLLRDLYGFGFLHENLRFESSKSQAFVSIRNTLRWFQVEFPLHRPAEVWLMYFIYFLSTLDIPAIKKIISDFAFKKGELIRILSFKQDSSRIYGELNNPSLSASKVYNVLNPYSYEVILLIYSQSQSRRVKKYIKDFLAVYNFTRIKVTGHDLSKLGIRPGPDFKTILQMVLEGKLNLRLSTKRQELSLARKLIKR